MASFDPPETPARADVPATTGIQAPAETPSIPLAPLPRPPAMSGEQFTRLRRGFDALLVALVLFFAFLIASFPATNPDFFRQAAVGRLIAQGTYPFGADPFSFAGDDVYSVNHSWLFGLLIYALYQIPSVGGAVVVICKALLVAALAEVLLRTSRRVGQSLWIPAACTALAVLAISPRLFLQSTCLSFLFLGLTLWLLQRPQRFRAGASPEAAGPPSFRSWWWLPPLFALWANCDAWFFLGPLAVALYLIGELVQPWLAPGDEGGEGVQRQGMKMLGLVLLIGLAACLVNPHHVRVFTLPPELGLSPAADMIDRDVQFRSLTLSPLRGDYYEPRHGWSVAGMSYWPLLLAGLVSIVFTFGRVPGWRLTVWLGFALLSLYNARCIPFFAIVAGPITARNWLDFIASRPSGVSPQIAAWRWWSLGGRVLTVLLVLVLLAATVPGWLQAQPYDYHRVGWRVVIDPSLRQTAEQIKEWRKDRKLPDEPHWFNMHTEIANYLAWFAPGERVFLDQQLPYFPKAADDYQILRESLEQMVPEGNAPNDAPPASLKKKWEKVLRDRHIRYWIFDDIQQKANRVARHILFSSPEEWVLCSLHGRVAIFAWKDPMAKNESDPSHDLKLDLKNLAFGPEAERAPPQGPEVVVPPRDLWHRWLHGAPAPSMDRQTAALYDFRFEVLDRPRYLFEVYQNSRAYQAMIAVGAIGSSLPRGPIPNSLLALSWSCTYHDLFPPGRFQPARQVEPREQEAMRAWSLYVNSRETDLPASLYLAVRAARRGLLDNPQDLQTYLLLGETYGRLDGQPHERSLKSAVPLAAEIRRTQMAAAFQNCLRFQPGPAVAADAHAALFGLFEQLPYRDVTTHHLREWINNLRAAGPKPNMSPTQHAQNLEKMARDLERREAEVKREQNLYVLEAAKKPALEKVSLALKKGLAETALTALDQAATGELSGQKDLGAVRDVMALLLHLGRLDKARELLIPEAEETAGKPVSPEYLELHLLLAAARGDYELADRLLADALNYTWKSPSGQSMHSLERMSIGSTVGRVLLAEGQRLGRDGLLLAEGQQSPSGGLRIPWVPNNPADIYRQPWGQSPSDYWVRRWRLDALETGLSVGQQRADWCMVRGWLAVESGHCVEARGYFQNALDTMTPAPRWMPEVNRLNVLLSPVEAQFLQELAARQGLAHNLSRQYLKWLEASQR